MNELRNDKKVGSTALALLERYREQPFFFFVHFQGTDVKGHFFGENSPQYERALISADTWTGRIIDKLKELQIYEETLVYVAGDHGFGEGAKFHFEAPYTFLATNDREVMRRGYREDIAPTILERFGMDLETIDPPLSGHTLTKPYSPPIW